MPSLRSIAEKLGLSSATVSSALSGKGRVSAKTILRVEEAAKAAGYVPDPLRSSFMSDVRRSRTKPYHGEMAAINYAESHAPRLGPFNRELFSGAKERAASLGFSLAEFHLGRDGVSVARLDRVLRSRNIRGVLVLPFHDPPALSHLSWSRYSAIYADCNIGEPRLHCIHCDQYRSIKLMLERLAKRGYRRPGLFLTKRRDDHAEGRWTAGFSTFQRQMMEGAASVPPLIVSEARESEFARWFETHRPDLVISHNTEAIEWMERCGARLPATHGFASLNLTVKTRPCAGLDFQPKDLGARAIDLIITQVLRNERGTPEHPLTATLLAGWVEGPTVVSG
jgi:LacI family transcriptional regulator